MKRGVLFGAAAAVVILGGALPALAQAPVDATASARMGPWGFDPSGMDPSVKPGDDFFSFVDGAWAARTEIPADRSSYGSFAILRDLSDTRVHGLLDAALANPGGSPAERRIADFYASFMDEAHVEALGAAPVAADLAAIKSATTHVDLARLHGDAYSTGIGATLWGAGLIQDSKHPDRYVVNLVEAGIGLPDRDYYLKSEFAEIRARYRTYIERLLTAAGWSDPAGSATAILAFETRLAEGQWPIEDTRDIEKTYNPATFDELMRLAPSYDWGAFFDAAGLPRNARLVLAEKPAFGAQARVFAETPVATLQAWQAFQLLDNSAPLLSHAFADAAFEFREKTLQGQPRPRPRWKQGVALVSNGIPHDVGRLYAERYFPPQSKAKAEALVAALQTALHGRIAHVNWMSEETKARAVAKLDKFTANIGYPPRWLDYATLEIRRDDAFGNVRRAGAWEWRREVARLDQPVDRQEWSMTPQTVNAEYRIQNNDITFPAGILQPPFFDPDADPAINFGGIGGVIGHEITHGFDDQGRKSDGDGVLQDWWTAADAAKFETRATALGAQYYAFEPLPGAHVNPKLTLGENIADLGGLLMALDAYHIYLNGRPAPVIDGYTGDQRVFLGWAQVWRTKFREPALRQLLATNEHSPGMLRVNAVVRNIDAWYEAFGVKPGDRLYLRPEDRVRIW